MIDLLSLFVLLCFALLFGFVLVSAFVHTAGKALRQSAPSNVIGFPAKWHPSMSDAYDGNSTRGER